MVRGLISTTRLINFIHTKAAETECQSVEAILELRKSLHAVDTKQKGPVFSITPEWTDDKFLTLFLENDPLLYSFDDDDDVEEFDAAGKTMTLQELLESNGGSSSPSSLDTKAPVDSNDLADLTKVFHSLGKGMREEPASPVDMPSYLIDDGAPGLVADLKSSDRSSNGASEPRLSKKDKKDLKVTFAEVAKKELLNVNKDYFGSYSAFGIHRECFLTSSN